MIGTSLFLSNCNTDGWYHFHLVSLCARVVMAKICSLHLLQPELPLKRFSALWQVFIGLFVGQIVSTRQNYNKMQRAVTKLLQVCNWPSCKMDVVPINCMCWNDNMLTAVAGGVCVAHSWLNHMRLSFALWHMLWVVLCICSSLIQQLRQLLCVWKCCDAVRVPDEGRTNRNVVIA